MTIKDYTDDETDEDLKDLEGLFYRAAVENYADDDVVILQDAEVSRIEGGAWVDARVFVHDAWLEE